MSVRRLQFRFTSVAGTVYRFDADGEWSWRLLPIYRVNTATPSAGTPVIEEVRDEWILTGSLVSSSDGTAATGWDEFKVLRDAIVGIDGTGGDPIATVEIVRDPSGAAEAELTLGAGTYQDLRVEEVRGDPADISAGAATWGVVFPFTITVTARRIEADANGLVNLEQTIQHEFRDGRERITWDTTVTTAEGTDAVARAKTYGVIPFGVLGESWAYETGDTDGVDWTELDPDTTQSPDRTPTRVRALSIVQRYGVSVGTTGPGTAPAQVDLEDTTETTSDQKLRRRRAFAAGPSARNWVISQKPSWAQDEVARDRSSHSEYERIWTASDAVEAAAEGSQWIMQGELSGGHESFTYEPVVGGYEPVRFVGPVIPWSLKLTVTVEKQGGTGDPAEMRFPAELSSPWRLDRNNSTETEPVRLEFGRKPSETRWRRQAVLQYWSATRPSGSPVFDLRRRADEGVLSYYL